MIRRSKPAVLPAIASGLAAGALATIVMDQFLKLATSSQKAIEKQIKLSEGESEWAVAHEQTNQEQQTAQKEDSTEIVARKIAESTGRHLSPETKKTAGRAVHYSFGTLVGVIYACTAELVPEATTGAGTAFGTALFLAADEIAVPAFRLAPPPNKQPASDQLEHWAAHVVYGATLEIARTLLRKLF